MIIKKYIKGQPVQLSPHFSTTEFDCKCHYPECKETLIDMNLVEKLDTLRNKLGKPVSLDCAYRCPRHNAEVGGVVNSEHIKGIAADINAAAMNIEPADLAKICEEVGFDGIGTYPTKHFVHADTRGAPARWVG